MSNTEQEQKVLATGVHTAKLGQSVQHDLNHYVGLGLKDATRSKMILEIADQLITNANFIKKYVLADQEIESKKRVQVIKK